VRVKQYSDEKFLSFGTSSTSLLIDDIGDVLVDTESTGGRTIDGEIDSVLSSASFHKCKLCNSKVDMLDENLGRCTKCKALLKLSKCPVTMFAKILITPSPFLSPYSHKW
jgi:hypothetical protein